LGSNTSSGALASYRTGGFADTRKWIVEGWADYMVPQLYWHIGQSGSAYDVLLNWWAELHEQYPNVHLYIGHANYKHVDSDQYTQVGWQNPQQIPMQLDLIDAKPIVKGSSFYSYRSLINLPNTNTAGLPNLIASNDLVRPRWQLYKTIVPPKTWINNQAPAAPSNVRQNGSVITWNASTGARYYVVYRGTGSANTIIADPRNIVAKVWHDQTRSFTDNIANPLLYTYIVTALNGAHVESLPGIASRN